MFRDPQQPDPDDWPDGGEWPDVPDVDTGDPIASRRLRSPWDRHHEALERIEVALQEAWEDAPCCVDGCGHCAAIIQALERVHDLAEAARRECDRRAGERA